MGDGDMDRESGVDGHGDDEDLFGSNVLFDSERGVEVRETLDRRDRRHVALRSYLGSARALEQALQINPKDTTVRTLRLEVGVAIGRMALGGRDYLLAREAFERLDAFGATAAQRDGYLKEVERSQGALLGWRRERLTHILKDLGQGLGREGRPRPN